MNKFILGLLFSASIISCGNQNEKAAQQLQKAKQLFDYGAYSEAKTAIDSIGILYPKAFEQIRSGMQLMCQVKLKESQRNLTYIDSLLQVRQQELETLKKDFYLEKDEKYQEEGNYIYKNQKGKTIINSSRIRALVTESGQMQLSSVYYGNVPLNHTFVRADLADKNFAETFRIPYDGGNNYRFKNDGHVTEIVTYKDGQCTEIVNLISENMKSPVLITYKGGKKYTLSLDMPTKQMIKATRDLTLLMKITEDLKREKLLNEKTIEIGNRHITDMEQKAGEK